MALVNASEVGLLSFNRRDPSPLELYEQGASIATIGAFECDLASGRLSWTNGLYQMFGLQSDRPIQRPETLEMYGEQSRGLLEWKRSRAIESRTGFSLEANISRFDGQERWIRITAAVRTSNGHAVALYGMKQDITEDRARWETLRAQAECDPLTGVANRVRFQRFLEDSSDEPLLATIGLMVLFDLDGFKFINDQWGHAAGDRCLQVFGERLRKTFPQARLISRIGGDEFVVLLPPTGSRSRMDKSVRSRIRSLFLPVQWNGMNLPLSASIGLAFPSEPTGLDPQALFNVADRALYDAKKTLRQAHSSEVRIIHG